MGENQLVSSLPAYDTHRIMFNMRYVDTMYTEESYYGAITIGLMEQQMFLLYMLMEIQMDNGMV